MKMTRRQEKACLGNIQGYLDRIHWLENDGDPNKGPRKICTLCEEFKRIFMGCIECPLGASPFRCQEEKYYIDANFFYRGLSWRNATENDLRFAMAEIMKKYKAAGLEIEIV